MTLQTDSSKELVDAKELENTNYVRFGCKTIFCIFVNHIASFPTLVTFETIKATAEGRHEPCSQAFYVIVLILDSALDGLYQVMIIE